MQPVLNFLSNYASITAEEAEGMVAIMHHSKHEKNEVLHRQGDISRRAAFILKGGVRSYYVDDAGEEHTVNFAFENHPLVSLDSFFQQTPAAVSTVTLEPTELIYTSYAEFFGFLEANPKYEGVIRKILSDVIVVTGEQAKLLRISSSRERYETFCKMRPNVSQRVPLKYIASYLEMAVETLSRVRAGKL